MRIHLNNFAISVNLILVAVFMLQGKPSEATIHLCIVLLLKDLYAKN